MFVIVMCGLPASGKTTLANKIKEINNDCVILSMDALRKRLPDGTLDQSNNREVFRVFYNDFLDCISNGRNVILDATNILPRGRTDFVWKFLLFSGERNHERVSSG